MLVFIGFPAIVSKWVEFGSLASSLRNDVLSDEHVYCHRNSPFSEIAILSQSWFRQFAKFPMAVQVVKKVMKEVTIARRREKN